MFILGQIWFNRNQSRFDGNYAPAISVITACKAYLIRVAKFGWDYARFGSERDLLLDLGVGIMHYRAPHLQIVSSIPPSRDWIKFNSDGMLKGSSHVSACGAVSRTCEGEIFAWYFFPLHAETAFVAELIAVILAIEHAFVRGWTMLWIECASSLACASSL